MIACSSTQCPDTSTNALIILPTPNSHCHNCPDYPTATIAPMPQLTLTRSPCSRTTLSRGSSSRVSTGCTYRAPRSSPSRSTRDRSEIGALTRTRTRTLILTLILTLNLTLILTRSSMGARAYASAPTRRAGSRWRASKGWQRAGGRTSPPRATRCGCTPRVRRARRSRSASCGASACASPPRGGCRPRRRRRRSTRRCPSAGSCSSCCASTGPPSSSPTTPTSCSPSTSTQRE